MKLLLTFLLVDAAASLRVSPAAKPRLGRRAAIGTLVALPASVRAYDYSSNENFNYKQRSYGNGQDSTAALGKSGKAVCPEGQRLTPDGFGGKKCVGQVKSVGQQVVESIVGDDAPAVAASKPTAVAAAPKKSVGESTRSSAPAAAEKPLTLDELIANSISQKEALLGRALTPDEKADMTAKVKKLMS